MEIKIICAWCKRVIYDPQTDQYPLEVKVSHGLCPLCYQENMEELKGMKNLVHTHEIGGEG